MLNGDRVRERMEQLGLTQAELARRVGISQPAVYGLLTSNKAGTRHLHKIARELRTTPEYLLGEIDDPDAEFSEPQFTVEERNWIDWLRAAAPEDRRALTRLARTAAHSAPSGTLHDKQQEYRAAG